MNGKNIFGKVAEKYHTTPEEVYDEIQKAIIDGFNNPDPDVQDEWNKVASKGEYPTPEDVIAYAMETLTAGRRG